MLLGRSVLFHPKEETPDADWFMVPIHKRSNPPCQRPVFDPCGAAYWHPAVDRVRTPSSSHLSIPAFVNPLKVTVLQKQQCICGYFVYILFQPSGDIQSPSIIRILSKRLGCAYQTFCNAFSAHPKARLRQHVCLAQTPPLCVRQNDHLLPNWL